MDRLPKFMREVVTSLIYGQCFLCGKLITNIADAEIKEFPTLGIAPVVKCWRCRWASVVSELYLVLEPDTDWSPLRRNGRLDDHMLFHTFENYHLGRYRNF